MHTVGRSDRKSMGPKRFLCIREPGLRGRLIPDRYQALLQPVPGTFSTYSYLPAVRLPPEVNRILYVRNLPYKITGDEMYDIFGKYGAIRQIRIGNTPDTKGTAFVVYEDIFDAKNACDHLSGFNVCNRYLVVLYYQATKAFKKTDDTKKKDEIDKMKQKYGLSTPEKK
ncbi:hypothetical protein FSP39_002821 [Pinctada imbricata]|uniref:RRM domain-containing protein n=1 Tax=Pinctada imbricata TaxID=66713 RepID=A0AA88XTF2_PINIB|nr:hypothetical protein FSP39_002821 [Pinctada imbricata]